MTTKNSDNEVYILGSGTKPESGPDGKKVAKKNLHDSEPGRSQASSDDVAERQRSRSEGNSKRLMKLNLWIIGCILLVLAAGSLIFLMNRKEQTPEYYFEPEQTAETASQSVSVIAPGTGGAEAETPFIEMAEEAAGATTLRIYTPHNATMSLTIGMPDKSDSTIVFAAMAADIRKDNLQIVGDFVLSGKRLARGIAKKGYAAMIDDKITIGVGESTPLLQEAIDRNGSFFRQYPLVSDGEPAENKPKGRSIRRALAVRGGQVIMAESIDRLSFQDFSQALITIGVTDAIYLVGSDAYGWYQNKEHTRQEFGKERTDIPENISYILWR